MKIRSIHLINYRKLIIYIVILSAISGNCFSQLVTAGSHNYVSTKIADHAFQIITSLISTKYKSFPYTIDAGKGIFETDCAGFITHLLKQKAPKHLSLIPLEDGKLYHTVSDYYNYFDGIKDGSIKGDTSYWQIITKLNDTKRGDILTWVDDENFPNSSTSHILVLADTPKLLADNLYEAVVYDASDRSYNKDTRQGSGVGYGYIRFHSDANNNLIEYQLRIDDTFHKSNFVIARAL